MSQLALAPSSPPGLQDSSSCICDALARLGGVGVLVAGSAIPFLCCISWAQSRDAVGVRNDTFIAAFNFGTLQRIHSRKVLPT